MIIISINLTRIQCMKNLFHYLRLILDQKSADEIHIWDRLTHPEDMKWLRRNVIADKRVRIYEKGEPNYSPDDIIVHCADTIVFIDVRRFDQFVQKGLAAAHVINGDAVCAMHQRLYGFVSADLFTPETCEQLYQNAAAATEMHSMFLDHFNDYLEAAEKSPDAKTHFANSPFWVEGPGGPTLDMSMVVANLYTTAQLGDGFDDQRFATKYTMLKDRYAEFLRNGGSDCKTD